MGEELPWLQGRDNELITGEAIRDWLGWKRPIESMLERRLQNRVC
jgi:hypothetical protein